MSAADYLFGPPSKDVCKRVKADLPDDLRSWVSVNSAKDHWRVEVQESASDDLSRFMAAKPGVSVTEARFSVPKGVVPKLMECLGFASWPPGVVSQRDHYTVIRLTPATVASVTVERLKDFLAEALRGTLQYNALA